MSGSYFGSQWTLRYNKNIATYRKERTVLRKSQAIEDPVGETNI